VALNFVWSRVAPLVRSKQAADCFHQSWFRSWESMQHLISAVDVVFKAALQFYRVRRGKGAKAIDVSSFFKRKNLHVDFESFWNGSTNQRKGAFKRAWTRYERKFREEVES
jgi:predicted metalloprotease